METKIIEATADYTGGGIYIYNGKLSDGNYFIACNDWNFIVIANADTSTEEARYPEFYDKHEIKTLTDEEYKTFYKLVLNNIIKVKPKGNYCIGDLKEELNRFDRS